jgi:hypothetical protein
MKVAIHQPNAIPWFPFFEKMQQADIFVILTQVQFEKNGWQNRCQVNGKWWTNPVSKGLTTIDQKQYADGNSLLEVNMMWIYAMASTLGIPLSKIKFDFPTEKKGTARLVEICRCYGASEYLTNMDALEKYLDQKLFNDAGIKIVPFVSKYKKHTFEMFAEHGIQGTKELLRRG